MPPKPSRFPHRRVFCRHTAGCLDIALREGWRNFSCEGCGDYEPEMPGDPDYWGEQAARCAGLLSAALKVGAAPRGEQREAESACFWFGDGRRKRALKPGI